MLIRVEKIKPEGLYLDFVEEGGDFPVLQEMADSGECSLLGPIRVRLQLFRVGDKVEMKGSVAAKGIFSCSRCLDELEDEISSEFTLIFFPEEEQEESVTEEDVELTEDDLGAVYFSGETIDISESLQEQILMALPIQPLCSDDCLGLCPQCGKNRNRESCNCEPPVFNNKFAILKDIVKS